MGGAQHYTTAWGLLKQPDKHELNTQFKVVTVPERHSGTKPLGKRLQVTSLRDSTAQEFKSQLKLLSL